RDGGGRLLDGLDQQRGPQPDVGVVVLFCLAQSRQGGRADLLQLRLGRPPFIRIVAAQLLDQAGDLLRLVRRRGGGAADQHHQEQERQGEGHRRGRTRQGHGFRLQAGRSVRFILPGSASPRQACSL